jgi:penicillin-insensitive murein endopeptidase
MIRIHNLLIVIIALPLVLMPTLALAIAFMTVDDGKPSVCYGNAINGRLENGKRLLYAGPNYRAYHIAGFITGRTFMHSSVRDAVRDAYAALEKSNPDLRFVYAESGWPHGGKMWPHRTHANGTAVDFMVPLRTDDGAIAQINASVINMLGYSVTFDDQGRRGTTRIDFDAIARHLLALDMAAKANGIHIRRVIFEPPLHRLLFASPAGRELQGKLDFMQRPAWVRHDQHYHVDFDVPCQESGRRERKGHSGSKSGD